ncbi:GNAT family N-acetyltransferase [Castellaniella sp.]|uniref:GNAT family N-acetyltransferase n=1 Tax=Castellaniella sp. TaxID=1955812 RepID=UPI002AFF120B|nr:GNAT family N-acetyltransferase [Castellaniella sp.]
MSSKAPANGATAGVAPRAIRHHAAASRFEWTEDGQLCVLDYVLSGNVAAFTHTGVPASVGGRGIAADLVRTGLDTARAQGWKIQAVCSYVAAYVQKHPEYQDLLADA